MPEWLMGADCKSVGYAYAGSNPARPNNKNKKLYNGLNEKKGNNLFLTIKLFKRK